MSEQVEEAAKRLQRKRDFFDALDKSTTSDDDTPDPGREASMKAMQKAAARKRGITPSKKQSDNSLPRSLSDTNLAKTKGQSKETSDLAAARPSTSNSKDKLPASLETRHTFSGTSRTSKKPSKRLNSLIPSSSTTNSKSTGKRKRGLSQDPVPYSEQIFRDLKFYFFPNTDTHPARRMRIEKATSFGATWERDFCDDVTHVIVDKAMDYGRLLKFVKRDKLPDDVIIVSEDYPAECISYKTLLDPRQLQFKVKGCGMPAAPRPVSSKSDQSLQLKAADRLVQARQPETQSPNKRAPTPPRSVSSDDDDRDRLRLPPADATSKMCSESKVQSTEEFDNAIQKAKELQNVPLDNDDEPISRPSSSEGPGTDDEKSSRGAVSLVKRKPKLQNFQDKFQCMQNHTGAGTPNPNADTIAILQQMADYYGQIGDEWRIRAYLKAIATLRNHPTKVWTREDALALPQIGERLATKIDEIAFTNRLRRLDSARAEPSDQILQTFMKVYGAGYAQASKWVAAGYTTLDEILAKADITHNQRIGIEHYEDFNSRIPRAEVAQHGSIVRKTLQKIDPAFEIIIGGSYRRGSETSGDIDCIITRPNTKLGYIRQIVLDQLVPKLFAKNFLVAELAGTDREDGSKWHGASSIPNPKPKWRRIDLLLVPSDELGAALIYFTGNDIFNCSMRLLASTKGMRLNQRGLYKDVIRGKGREKLSEGTLVEGRDEKRIFEVLGVPWRPPEHRIC